MNKALGETFGEGKERCNRWCPRLIYSPQSLSRRLPIPDPRAPFSASQVCSADTSQPLPDTMNARDLPWSERMCPLPLAPAKPSLLACPEGLDLRLCALQKIPLGRASQDLREDASNTSESGALGLDLGALLVG